MVHSPASGRSALLNVMCRAVYKAARKLVRDFGEVEQLQVSVKGPGDFVSAADKQAEKTLYEELSSARPGYSFLMEESGVVNGEDSSYCWIIDPLDGTTNFLHGIPHFAISVGLQHNGEIIAGVIYDPVKDEMFCAEKGCGAFLNNKRIRVSRRENLPVALLVTGLPARNQAVFDRVLKVARPLGGELSGLRSFGATALDLAYVAAGRFDGFWHQFFKSWDVAAGIVLIREAGGFVTDLNNDQNVIEKDSILATNGHLHKPLMQLLKK